MRHSEEGNKSCISAVTEVRNYREHYQHHLMVISPALQEIMGANTSHSHQMQHGHYTHTALM